eukprot:gnl/MRDRNA2_/MRDRNA2_122305_c0_seq1.p1 gnl/MRDRNA2_/MRDRNA2_122305_c0~~gnl/MRDRNA2_/MRDRNA2_122305_c0_seq1.p1  ORF type:complete len:251 (-),score=53.79 gnl/MRDRNA2_/MRDRNA2_122305_c0_seq1:68-820(-)
MVSCWWLVAAILHPSSTALKSTSPSSLSEQLFTENLAVANQSLYGRFVQMMANGTLPQTAFQRYLEQDNLYLSKYARAVSRLASTSDSDEEFLWLTNQSFNYLYEHNHSSTRTEADFESKAGPVTIAYTSLFSEAAAAGDRLLAFAAILPCQHLYDYIFATLWQQGVADDNPYKKFIAQYADTGNHEETKRLESYFDQEFSSKNSILVDTWIGQQQSRAQKAQFYYATAMRFEAQFWEQALNPITEEMMI